MTAHPVDVHVGKRLRQRRRMLGLSQQAIGKATGVTFQQVQKYERGVNRMGSSRLYQYARLLSVPISYFFEEFDSGEKIAPRYGKAAENEKAKFEHEQLVSSRETIDLVRAYYRIKDPQVRRRINDLIRSLADSE